MQAEACVSVLQKHGWGSSMDFAFVLLRSLQVRDCMYSAILVELVLELCRQQSRAGPEFVHLLPGDSSRCFF